MGSAAVEINLHEINKLAQKMNSFVLSGGDKAGLLKSLGLVIEEQTKERFDFERDPQDDPWRKLTDAYKKRKGLISTGGILVKEGYLRGSIENQLKGNDSIIVGSPMEYAGYHQDAKKEDRRRPFLGFSTSNIIELQESVDVFMKEHIS